MSSKLSVIRANDEYGRDPTLFQGDGVVDTPPRAVPSLSDAHYGSVGPIHQPTEDILRSGVEQVWINGLDHLADLVHFPGYPFKVARHHVDAAPLVADDAEGVAFQDG